MAHEITKTSTQLAERPVQAIEAIGGKATDIDRSSEVSAVAMAAAAKAQIEAKLVMAMHRPRSYDVARERLLETCRRPGFADKSVYKKPQGKAFNEDTGKWEQNYIRGLSVRFAEEAARNWGNIDITAKTIYDDDERMVVEVTATDLETIATESDSAIITKRIERKGQKNGGAPQGRDVIGVRLNSYGDKVYICRATDDEVMTRAQAAKAKLRRNLILALLPIDLKDEAREVCEATSKREAESGLPDKRARMIEAFGQLKPPVSADALSKYLGHDVRQCTVQEALDLKQVMTALSEGSAKWEDFLESKLDDRAPVAPQIQSPVSADEQTKAQDVDNPPTEPLKGTGEFAEWLVAGLKQAPDIRSLTALARRKADCPAGSHADVLAAFNSRRSELTKSAS